MIAVPRGHLAQNSFRAAGAVHSRRVEIRYTMIQCGFEQLKSLTAASPVAQKCTGPEPQWKRFSTKDFSEWFWWCNDHGVRFFCWLDSVSLFGRAVALTA
jgi:hypothetical protein